MAEIISMIYELSLIQICSEQNLKALSKSNIKCEFKNSTIPTLHSYETYSIQKEADVLLLCTALTSYGTNEIEQMDLLVKLL